MRKTINKLTLIYYCVYLLALLFAVGGYYYTTQQEVLGVEEFGKQGTAITSIYIIFLVASIPLALKFFNVYVKKLAASDVSNEEKIKRYFTYSVYRLAIIGVGLLAGIYLFYALNSRSMIFCAGIAAIALVFCKPSEVKMANELDIDDEE